MEFLRWRHLDPSSTDAIADAVDALVRGDEGTFALRRLLATAPTADVAGQLRDLIALAGRLKHDLAPVELSVTFEESVKGRLLAAAAARAPAPIDPIVVWRKPRFLIGAATVGSLVSAVAVIALVARSRHASPAQAA